MRSFFSFGQSRLQTPPEKHFRLDSFEYFEFSNAALLSRTGRI